VHAELTLGLGVVVNHKRVARLMREAGIQGLYRRRRRGCTVRDLQAEPYLDLVDRDFVVEGPDEIWCTDITEHPKRGRGRCTALRSSMCSLAESLAGRSATTCAPNS
jgi:putative transposase